jgi:deoxycytidylate deaminase
MYTYPANLSPSCDRCATVIIQSGIKHIVHEWVGSGKFAENWRTPCESALQMYEEAGVYIQRFGLDKAPQDLSLTDLVFGQHLK